MKHAGTCSVCGKHFERNRPLRGATCSARCRGVLRRRESVQRICKHCGSQFAVRPSSNVKFCSIACFNQSPHRGSRAKTPMLLNCSGCGKEFKRHAGHLTQRYCSVKCRDTKSEPPRRCKFCDREFTARRPTMLYCSRACGARNRFKGKQTYQVSTRAKAALMSDDPQCGRCGYHKVAGILQIHHKDRNKRNNTPENVELVCPNCHEEEHFAKSDGRYHSNKPQNRSVTLL